MPNVRRDLVLSGRKLQEDYGACMDGVSAFENAAQARDFHLPTRITDDVIDRFFNDNPETAAQWVMWFADRKTYENEESQRLNGLVYGHGHEEILVYLWYALDSLIHRFYDLGTLDKYQLSSWCRHVTKAALHAYNDANAKAVSEFISG